MRIDRDNLGVLALCDQCDYRTLRPTSAQAWTALAYHVKAAHDDPAAVGRIRDAAWRQRRRDRQFEARRTSALE